MQSNVKIINNLISDYRGLDGEAWIVDDATDAYGVTFVCGWNRTLEASNLSLGAAKRLVTAVGRLHEEFVTCMASSKPDFDLAEEIDDKLRRLFSSGPKS